MSTEKDVRQVVVIDIADLVGKSITVYDNTTGQAYGLDGQKLLDIASQNIAKSQSIATDTGSTEKVPVVAAVELELNKKVSKTGNETVAGIKTFSSSPLVPAPTANTQTANKKYVDDEVAKKQTTIVFGIANTNAVKINSESVAENQFAAFTALGLKGLTDAQVIERLGVGGHADYSIETGIGGTLGHIKASERVSWNNKSWGAITDKPTSFAPSAHEHTWTNIAGKPTTLVGYGISASDVMFDNKYSAADHNHAGIYEPAITKKTAFNKDFGTIAGTVLEGRTFGSAANNNTGDFLAYNGTAVDSNKLGGQLPSYYQTNIAAGTTLQYYRGDKSWQTLNTSVVPESGYLYFNTSRVLATALTGYSVGTDAILAATDTILAAFGKTQGQINNRALLGGALTQAFSVLSLNIEGTTLYKGDADFLKQLATMFVYESSTDSIKALKNFYSTSGVSAFGIGSGGGGGGGVNVIDNLTSTSVVDALSANQGRALYGYINAKQPQLNGTGFVKISGTTISYDGNSYALSAHNHDWSAITSGKPTTLSGYGISSTDTMFDGRYLPISYCYEDRRTITPQTYGINTFQIGFTSNDLANGGTYSDFINFGGYNDSTGGRQNIILFRKDAFGIRQYQGTFRNSSYNYGYVDYLHSGNFTSYADSAGAAASVQGNLNTHAGLTTTAHGLGASAFHTDTYFALLAGSPSQPFSASTLTTNGVTSLGGILGITPGRGAAHFVFTGTDADYGVARIYHTSTEGSGAPGTYTATLALIDQRSNTISGAYEPNLFLNVTGAQTIVDLMRADVRGSTVFRLTQTGAATFASTVSATGFTASGYTVYHSGNLTQNLSGGYLPYWNGSAFVNSNAYTNGTNTAIGSTRNIYMLDIEGMIYSNTAYYNGRINNNSYILNSAGSYYGTIQNDAADKWSLGYGALALTTIGTPVLTWRGSGNVDIGYGGTRTEKLAVNGSGYFKGRVHIDSSSGLRLQEYGYGYWDINTPYENSNPDLIFLANGTRRFQVSASGQFDIGFASGRRVDMLSVNGSIYAATSIKIGSSWEAIPNGSNGLDLKYGGVLKATLSSAGDILAVGGVTCFVV